MISSFVRALISAFKARRELVPADELNRRHNRFEGRAIWLPKTEAERPNREFLEWHGDSVFRG